MSSRAGPSTTAGCAVYSLRCPREGVQLKSTAEHAGRGIGLMRVTRGPGSDDPSRASSVSRSSAESPGGSHLAPRLDVVKVVAVVLVVQEEEKQGSAAAEEVLAMWDGATRAGTG